MVTRHTFSPSSDREIVGATKWVSKNWRDSKIRDTYNNAYDNDPMILTIARNSSLTCAKRENLTEILSSLKNYFQTAVQYSLSIHLTEGEQLAQKSPQLFSIMNEWMNEWINISIQFIIHSYRNRCPWRVKVGAMSNGDSGHDFYFF